MSGEATLTYGKVRLRVRDGVDVGRWGMDFDGAAEALAFCRHGLGGDLSTVRDKCACVSSVVGLELREWRFTSGVIRREGRRGKGVKRGRGRGNLWTFPLKLLNAPHSQEDAPNGSLAPALLANAVQALTRTDSFNRYSAGLTCANSSGKRQRV